MFKVTVKDQVILFLRTLKRRVLFAAFVPSGLLLASKPSNPATIAGCLAAMAE